MDDDRFEELMRKRRETGLSKEEADELGRMLAERSGQPYSNAEIERDGGGGYVETDEATPADARPHDDIEAARPAPDDKAATRSGDEHVESGAPEHGRRVV